MIDLNDVALLVQVVRHGSFAEAGRRLGLPPNTVSRRVQQLEHQLGARLLHRSTRQLTLTSAGQAFYDRCAGAVDQLDEAGQALAAGGQQPSGLVRVAATADFFDFFAIEWVAAFLAEHGLVKLEFVLSDDPVDLIAEKIDVAIRGGALDDSGYIGRRLVMHDDGLLASPEYLAARGEPERLEDLAHHDCLTAPQPGRHATWRLVGPDGVEEEVQVSGRFTANTAQGRRKAAIAGLGIARLPPAMAQATRDVEAGRLVRVLPQYRYTGRGLSVLYPSREHLPLAVSAFIDLVLTRVGEMEGLTDQPASR
jgi:DNA-binding transcriptional LysR family regulator